MAKTRQPRELSLIASLRARVAHAGSSRRGRGGVTAGSLEVGIGDDCAVLDVPRGHQIVVTTDFSLENVHFRRDWHSPEAVGHRCLARGLSDLAAMGARPLAAFLSLALPVELTRSRMRHKSWRDRFFDGLLALADANNIPLAGGDTAEPPELGCEVVDARRRQREIRGLALADIVLVGIVPRGRALLRSGAKAGDQIYVTGRLGGAAAELEQISQNAHRPKTKRKSEENPHPHLFPKPRIDVGIWLVKNGRATAAIDISDGLSTDLDHLCEESSVTATINVSTLPIHPLALGAPNGNFKAAYKLALHGGEDYELLFTAAPETRVPREIAGVPITRIGEVRPASPRRPRMVLVESNRDGSTREHTLLPHGWEHYR